VKIASKPVAALAVLAIATFSDPSASQAGNGGAVAAGLLGGFAAGAIIGAATAPRPYYYGPPPAYYAPPPYAYPAPAPAYAPECHWARGEPVWNGVAWVRPRMQVCD
jgi:hypothetical protein